jgi:hypothetical protein
MEALVDRLIPPDPETPGGKDAGCAIFTDRQMQDLTVVWSVCASCPRSRAHPTPAHKQPYGPVLANPRRVAARSSPRYRPRADRARDAVIRLEARRGPCGCQCPRAITRVPGT